MRDDPLAGEVYTLVGELLSRRDPLPHLLRSCARV